MIIKVFERREIEFCGFENEKKAVKNIKIKLHF